MIEQTNKARLAPILERGSLFAILDGAAVDGLPRQLARMQPTHVCLYRGELAADMVATAPYLVHLAPNHAFTNWMLEKAWGNNWGVFVEAGVDIKALRKHFRGFLMVDDPNGRSLYFRYYDPRVLRVYLPTCCAQELVHVFGPVKRYWVEDDENGLVNGLDRESFAKQVPQASHQPRSARLRIRSEQMAVFDQHATERFQRQMTTHIREQFPRETAAYDDTALYDFVGRQIEQASEYHITDRPSLAQYLNLAMIFGPHFDQSDEHPWAGEILNNPSLNSGQTKMMYLNEAAREQAATETTGEAAG